MGRGLNPRPLVVSDVYFPRVNGVSTSIRSFHMDLAATGIETTLVAPEYAQFSRNERHVLRIKARSVPFDCEDSLMSWRELKRGLEKVPADQYNLVHIQTPFLAHYAGLQLARRQGVPVVATCHTYFEDYLHHYLPLLPSRAGAWIARHFMTHQLNAVDAVVSPSAQVRERLLEYGVTKSIRVIPTGMTADRFIRGDGRVFRTAHDIAPDVSLLLNVGRVAHEKNLPFLLRMFQKLRRLNGRTLLVIAGEGPARASLETLAQRLGIAEAVLFVGNLDRQTELSNCYAAADAFVFASRTETQGLVLLEAMAQAKPVISTACLGTRSVLTPESCAFVVDEDEDAFAATVAEVLGAPALARARGEQGRIWAKSWSSRAMAGLMADLYSELLQTLRRRASLQPALS
jgi:1,2-diacylglycerol 3-alpha-glucosyltransferase